jgi:response regulator RpfG family c-di-GMP phosphodiesterase
MNFISYKNDFPFLFPNNIPDSILLQRKDDSIQKLIKSSVDSVFLDFSSIEDDLSSLYKHIKYYNPSLKKPRLITVFSDVDYRNKVIVTDTIVLIGIDNYLGLSMFFIQKFLSPY